MEPSLWNYATVNWANTTVVPLLWFRSGFFSSSLFPSLPSSNLGIELLATKVTPIWRDIYRKEKIQMALNLFFFNIAFTKTGRYERKIRPRIIYFAYLIEPVNKTSAKLFLVTFVCWSLYLSDNRILEYFKCSIFSRIDPSRPDRRSRTFKRRDTRGKVVLCE